MTPSPASAQLLRAQQSVRKLNAVVHAPLAGLKIIEKNFATMRVHLKRAGRDLLQLCQCTAHLGYDIGDYETGILDAHHV